MSLRTNIRAGQQYRMPINYTLRFGTLTASTRDIAINPAARRTPAGKPNIVDYENMYGNNIYGILNNNMPVNNDSAQNVQTNNFDPISNAGGTRSISKSSSSILSAVTNSNTYADLSNAKSDLEVGKDNMKADFNDSLSSYVAENVQATLSELGIEIPTLDPISTEFDDYDKDMKIFEKSQNKCQGAQDECNEKLPEISEKKCLAQSRVDSLKSQVSNLKAQIIAAKAAGQDTSALEAELAKKKAELDEAKKELEKYKKQEKALNDGISQLDKKKEDIEKNKEDLTNYHEAEARVVDKTYEIARKDDQKLNEALTKMENKKREIKRAAKDNNKTSTNGSDDIRNTRLEGLQQEYQKLALETSDISVDLDSLVSDNEGSKNVKNSRGQIYSVQHLDEAKKALEEDQSEE